MNGLERCVVCNRPMDRNHKCSPVSIARVEKKYREYDRQQEELPTYDEKLAIAFSMVNQNV